MRPPKPAQLLTREAFRQGVFERDRHRCVLCQKPGRDAHHIIERRLFPDGGYYLDNGATVCPDCHIRCETTEISVETVRQAAGIVSIIVPPSMYPEQPTDKWGNTILPDGTRARGPLMGDASVQKILRAGGMIDRIRAYTKYGRTMHVPWSPGLHDDDRLIDSMEDLFGHECVVMEKLDGENTSVYTQHMHARSIDSAHHPSQDWVRAYVAQWQHEIPPLWRFCGENVYAQHSIPYTNLPHYFFLFSIWNEANMRLHFDEMLEWAALLNITVAPQLFRGMLTREVLRAFDNRSWDQHEGYVITTVEGFSLQEFPRKVAKYVRANHVQTNKHWKHGQAVVPNTLAPPYDTQPGLLFARP